MTKTVKPGAKAPGTAAPVPGTGLLSLTLDSCQLWADSCAVIAMRTSAILTQRPGSEREAVRMVTEKWHAAIELGTKLALAPHDPVKTSLDFFGPRVSANRKRLERMGGGK
ncbi:hypothetical protein [Novosphingobium album (ex Hu et al. 2023)]|uniref:Uncharacterized protein n=1 Tax=Novosphingobium album (ex Hu et al. 2023) TaxID=2930093 RepID=A0ABT0B3X3_9SPHN|nr:hypothetical protein [Novosphingobium album (ex Hu et al. 2023)]MCJ2179757.1 hypothetical protein [Novosphingobium album (ex Hu et al. 2023)]